MSLLLLFGGAEDRDEGIVSAFRIAAGDLINHLSRDNVTLTASPAAATGFGTAALSDGRCNEIFKFGSLGADPTLTLDLNGVSNGNLDTWAAGVPTGFTKSTTGTATVTETTTAGERVSGSAAKLTAGNGQALIRTTYVARAGERLIVQVAIRGDGTNLCSVLLSNDTTGKYVTSGLAWGSGIQAVRTESGTSYVVYTFGVTVEDFATCRSDLVTLTLTVASATAAGVAYVDNIAIWPETDVSAFLHHNVDPLVDVQWRHSTDNFSASDDLLKSIVPYKSSFYDLSGSTRRYQRLKFSGTNSTRAGAIWAGEWFVGQVETLPVGYAQGGKYTSDFPMLSSRSGAGSIQTWPQTLAQVESYEWPFQALSDEVHDKLKELFNVRPRGGHHRVFVIPDDTVARVALGSFSSSSWAATPVRPGVWEGSAQFAGEPGPIVTS